MEGGEGWGRGRGVAGGRDGVRRLANGEEEDEVKEKRRWRKGRKEIFVINLVWKKDTRGKVVIE